VPVETALKELAAVIKARWVCEQVHQQMKEEPGVDHFEGRSWQGLHRHTLMTMIAHAFVQHQRLHKVGREKMQRHGPPQPTLPAIRRAVIAALSNHPPPQRCPHCRIRY
jgi:SRSO17 transposase